MMGRAVPLGRFTPLGQQAQSSPKSGAILQILPITLLAYSFLLLPPEVRVAVGGLNLYSYRLALIVLLPIVIFRYLRGETRVSVADGLIGLGSAWMVLSFVVLFGLVEGIVRGGALVLDFAGAYFVARISIASTTDFQRSLILIVPGALFAGIMMAAESISHRLLVRPFWRDIFGALPRYIQGEVVGELEYQFEMRLGLLRAFSTFSHPILGGGLLASLLPLYLFSSLRGWPKFTGILAAAAGFFSVSSAAILSLAVIIALSIVDFAKRWAPQIRWHHIASLGAIMLLAAQIASANGIVTVISRFTINPATAYIRQMQWLYGIEAIKSRPIFGFGYDSIPAASWMTTSIDAHFLAMGIRHGALVPILLFVTIGWIMIKLGIRASREPSNRDLMVGMNFAIFTLLIISMTVTYFGEANIWFMMVIGMGASLLSATSTGGTTSSSTPLQQTAGKIRA